MQLYPFPSFCISFLPSLSIVLLFLPHTTLNCSFSLHSIPYSLSPPFFILMFFFNPLLPPSLSHPPPLFLSSPSLPPLTSTPTLPLLPLPYTIAAKFKKPVGITVVVSIIRAKCANLGSCGVVGDEQYIGFWGNITSRTFYAKVDTKPETLIWQI